MTTPASVAKHPLHPMLVVFPIGLWVFSLICDIIAVMGDSPRWSDVAYYTMFGGLIGALVAAIPGLIDFLSITDPEAKRIGRNHMLLNLAAVGLYAVNLYLRTGGSPGAPLPIFLSVAGVLVLVASGWLGGELVYVHGVGIEPQAKTAERGNLRRIG